MIQWRTIFFVQGFLLAILAFTMALCALVGFALGDPTSGIFVKSSIFVGFLGGLVLLSTWQRAQMALDIQEAFLLTVISWVAATLFATLPFYYSGVTDFWLDALFESVSSLTTTGATVIRNLNYTPQSILLWRSLLQWLGGIGIVVMALTILPFLKIGGMQLFRSEFSDRSEKILPRVSQIASFILYNYLGFTLLCFLLLWLAGMTFFESLCHALTTLSTGGFSTADLSIQSFDNVWIEVILMVFMIIGGSTLILFVRLERGDWFSFFKDSQTRVYLSVMLISALCLALWLLIERGYGWWDALRHGAFTSVSFLTSTGFTTQNYIQWGSFPIVLIFFLSFIGGCTGSTAGGLKIFRLEMLVTVARMQLHLLRRPHEVYLPLYNGKQIVSSVFTSVLAFFALYIFCYGLIALSLSCAGMDGFTALSASAAAIGNVGQGLTEMIGPDRTYQPLSDSAKYIIMFGMILGRLEIFTLLILLTPSFWRK